MSPEDPGRQNRDGTRQPVDLPELRRSGAHQAVILVAEDEVMVRNLVTLLLQREGHLVLAAADGYEGLVLSRKYPGRIDLVITDLEMPQLNGADLCAQLLEERPELKALVVSSEDMSEIVGQNANLPFLPKPFDGHALVARVRALLAAPAIPPVHLFLYPEDIKPKPRLADWPSQGASEIQPHSLGRADVLQASVCVL